ncbi:WhiB family transcriptional regulator [Streptomyces sp. NBC_00356]|uniref:WhiB family transcriptional regulator n=1 Tax=Streptomyces sp. NBC_00356 TaxID=2975724 RepID=UPI002E2737B2
MNFDWMDSALCAQTDPELFHVEGSGTGYGQGKKICARCPVTAQCAEFAQRAEGDIAHGRRYGLWGGQLPRRRAQDGGKTPRKETHAVIIRLHQRGGMTPDEIAAQAGVDQRTVFRVVADNKKQQEAA